MKSPFNPFKQEIKFSQAVNNAIYEHNFTFNVYRTYNGHLMTMPLRVVTVNLTTGDIQLICDRDNERVVEIASKQDRTLIAQRARALNAAN